MKIVAILISIAIYSCLGDGSGFENILPAQVPPPFTVSVKSYVTGVVYFRRERTKEATHLFPQLLIMDRESPMIVMAWVNKTQSFGRIKILILEILDNLDFVRWKVIMSLILIKLSLILRFKFVEYYIYRYKYSYNLNHNTKVVLLFPITTAEREMKRHLETFTLAGIFKVAVLIPANSTHPCRLLFHMPFAHTDEESFVTVENPKELAEGYPDKLRNLNGFEFNVQFAVKSPHLIYTNGNLSGLNVCFFDLIFQRWNATYKTTEMTLSFLEQNYTTNQYSDLFINKMPFLDLDSIYLFDFVVSLETDQYRVMVRNMPLHSIWSYIRIYFLYDYTIILWMNFVLISCLYYCILKRTPQRLLMDFHILFPIFFLLPSSIRIVTVKEKLFLVFVFIYVFFATLGFICNLTSQMVAYYPLKEIQTLNDLERKDIPIYTDSYIRSFLNAGKYNMTKKFLDRLQPSPFTPWTIPSNFTDLSAFIINMHTNQYFINSALNLDESGQSKFYILDTPIATVPLLYRFPLHSPYQDDFQLVLQWIDQSGIRRYWETMVLSQVEFTSQISFGSKQMGFDFALKFNHLRFTLLILAIGNLMSFVVFLLEICWPLGFLRRFDKTNLFKINRSNGEARKHC